MKKVDVRSFLIGALATALTFVLIGADDLDKKDGNLGYHPFYLSHQLQ